MTLEKYALDLKFKFYYSKRCSFLITRAIYQFCLLMILLLIFESIENKTSFKNIIFLFLKKRSISSEYLKGADSELDIFDKKFLTKMAFEDWKNQ